VATASASWVRRVTRPSYMCLIMAQATDSCKPRNPNGDNYFRDILTLAADASRCSLKVGLTTITGSKSLPNFGADEAFASDRSEPGVGRKQCA